MSEITNPFDPSKDYMDELSSDDKYENDSGRVYPYLRGLKKLAYEHRGGVKKIRSIPVKVPSVNTSGGTKEVPDCIAACTISYEFCDGTVFEGSADASYKAHKAPFNKHLLATAESKAEARAIRRAFNISQVAKEEMGGVDEDDVNTDDEKIKDSQIKGIRTVAKRKRLSQKEVCKMAGKPGLDDIKELNQGEAKKALRLLNKYKPKEPVDASTD